jgi:hypothetical protein
MYSQQLRTHSIMHGKGLLWKDRSTVRMQLLEDLLRHSSLYLLHRPSLLVHVFLSVCSIFSARTHPTLT